MKTSSEILQLARQQITAHCPYVCNAVRKLLYTEGVDNHKVYAIIKQINADLAATDSKFTKGDTYSIWCLHTQGRWPEIEEAAAARHQWLDALINYYQQQGD